VENFPRKTSKATRAFFYPFVRNGAARLVELRVLEPGRFACLVGRVALPVSLLAMLDSPTLLLGEMRRGFAAKLLGEREKFFRGNEKFA
jgi:hypothetical protein